MRRYNIVSRIILTLTVITSALAAPVLVQEKRQACVDVVHVPEDVITVLRKRTLEEDLDLLWAGWWHYENVLRGPLPPPNVPLVQNLAHVHVPPWHSPADTIIGSEGSGYETQPSSPYSGHSHPPSTIILTDSGRESGYETQPSSPYSGHSYPPSTIILTDSDRESVELDDDVPPASPKWSTASEDWYTAPTSLGSSDSDWDPGRWSTTSNAPSEESQSENLKVVDYDLKGKAKVERRISGIARAGERGSDGVAECG